MHQTGVRRRAYSFTRGIGNQMKMKDLHDMLLSLMWHKFEHIGDKYVS
jgi:hypothetical protein